MIRRDGYAINIGEGEPGISAVGTAVNDLVGMPVAAIAIAVPAARMPNEESARAASDVLLDARQAILERIRDDL